MMPVEIKKLRQLVVVLRTRALFRALRWPAGHWKSLMRVLSVTNFYVPPNSREVSRPNFIVNDYFVPRLLLNLEILGEHGFVMISGFKYALESCNLCGKIVLHPGFGEGSEWDLNAKDTGFTNSSNHGVLHCFATYGNLSLEFKFVSPLITSKAYQVKFRASHQVLGFRGSHGRPIVARNPVRCGSKNGNGIADRHFLWIPKRDPDRKCTTFGIDGSRIADRQVGLMVLDEIHLLGADRGPILEVIVSRMRYISSQTERAVRFVGLSTALANAGDLADWLGVEEAGFFNFKPSVRPVPLEVHIQGYPGKYYCPRMNSMNKPAYAAISTHSPTKPVLIFVSSRRQTRLTALDLIQFASSDENPRDFLSIPEEALQMVLSQITDQNLRHTLQFGIGLHHAGLNDKDRSLVEELFANNKIQVLVCTSTLAWGVNLPAHLVIIKGTEYYDGKTKRYVDFPITDILQMMGRAGRPQFDQHGKAVILVHEPKKSFYKKFLYEPFPVESSLKEQLHEHINAEIVSGTICHKEDAVHYLTWTYLFRRLVCNPAYYGVENTDEESISSYLSRLVQNTFEDLEDSGCIKVDEDDGVQPMMLGSMASQYYLSYMTVSMFGSNIGPDTSLEVFLHILSGASEYNELPVRHNEENYNEALAKRVRYAVDKNRLDDPHVKANLLFQAHFSQLELPISDYVTDLKSVMDQSIRIIQAMIDVCANSGWLSSSITCMHLLQMVMQGLWFDNNSSLWMLPCMNDDLADQLSQRAISTVQQLLDLPRHTLQSVVGNFPVSGIYQDLQHFPRVQVKLRLIRKDANNGKHLSLGIRLEKTNAKKNTSRAFAPRFPKLKDEAWWMILGNTTTSELYAVKRVSFPDRLATQMVLPSSPTTFEGLKFILVSDCYLGFEQEHSLEELIKSQ